MKVGEIALTYRLTHVISPTAFALDSQNPVTHESHTMNLTLHMYKGKVHANPDHASRKMPTARARSSLYSLVNSTRSPVRG
jgi:hypothetical protein